MVAVVLKTVLVVLFICYYFSSQTIAFVYVRDAYVGV